MADFDVIVCGLGVMGSAALYQLARRGQRVLGLERFTPGHERGSSHGETRVIRLGYFEHPSYVPLLQRAYELWRELEKEARRPLLPITGILEIGAPASALVKGTLASAQLHRLSHEVLAAGALMQRYPCFTVPSDYLAVLQPDGGFVEAEQAIEATLALAAAAGAEIRSGQRVRVIEPDKDGVRVITDAPPVEARSAIITAGPWTSALLPELNLPLRATRQVVGWFEPRDKNMFSNQRLPVFIIESPHGMHYGIPPHAGRPLKVAKHHHANEAVDPEHYDRGVSAADEELIRVALMNYIPAANGALLHAETCLYTMAPDGDFVIDQLPDAPHVLIASPCSGHGFKFAPVIGEALAELATTGSTRHDISRFRLSRFAAAQQEPEDPVALA
ncbi:MAG: N-methyl-L-tryptophan oxidase [Xanthobacteraceae bacterium]